MTALAELYQSVRERFGFPDGSFEITLEYGRTYGGNEILVTFGAHTNEFAFIVPESDANYIYEFLCRHITQELIQDPYKMPTANPDKEWFGDISDISRQNYLRYINSYHTRNGIWYEPDYTWIPPGYSHGVIFNSARNLPDEANSLANERAEKHLAEMLDEHQLKCYRELCHFYCIGGTTGHLYRVNKRRNVNVDLIKDDQVVKRLCVVPNEFVPLADQLVQVKLMLECNEMDYLDIAIEW